MWNSLPLPVCRSVWPIPTVNPPLPPPYTDSLLISTNQPGFTVYDEKVAGIFQARVVGRASNVVGMLTCTSGAGTGVHCSIKINAINQFLPNLPPNVPG